MVLIQVEVFALFVRLTVQLAETILIAWLVWIICISILGFAMRIVPIILTPMDYYAVSVHLLAPLALHWPLVRHVLLATLLNTVNVCSRAVLEFLTINFATPAVYIVLFAVILQVFALFAILPIFFTTTPALPVVPVTCLLRTIRIVCFVHLLLLIAQLALILNACPVLTANLLMAVVSLATQDFMNRVEHVLFVLQLA